LQGKRLLYCKLVGFFAPTSKTHDVTYQEFPNAIVFIENLEIDDRKLLDFIEEIEDVEAPNP